MKVEFRNAWFGPNGARYRPANNPHEIGEEFLASLPSSAKIEGVPADEFRKKQAESAAAPAPTKPAGGGKIGG